jgi:hypothetical protein
LRTFQRVVAKEYQLPAALDPALRHPQHARHGCHCTVDLVCKPAAQVGPARRHASRTSGDEWCDMRVVLISYANASASVGRSVGRSGTGTGTGTGGGVGGTASKAQEPTGHWCCLVYSHAAPTQRHARVDAATQTQQRSTHDNLSFSMTTRLLWPSQAC